MRVLLDTNAYTALLAGDGRVADLLAKSEAVLLPAVVMGELLDGFAGGSREKSNRSLLADFMARPRTVCVPVTPDTAECFALVKQGLKRKGSPIPINDVWIAASCLEHGARLVSFDRHFEAVEGLLRWQA